MIITCMGCNGEKVSASFTSGKEIYPNRKDLHSLPFWICRKCGNYVGCQHKTRDRNRPLGCIPTKELRNARSHIHKLLDPIWKSGKISRTKIYRMISRELGFKFHTANIRSLDEARSIYRMLLDYKNTGHMKKG